MPTAPTEHRPALVPRAGLAIGAILLLAILVAAAIIGSRQGEADFDPTTPEATVQRYVKAVADRQATAVLDTFTDTLRERCNGTLGGSLYFPSLSRASLAGSTVSGSRATVEVLVTEDNGGGLFDPGGTTSRQQIVLTQTAAGWRISEVPWPFFACITKVGP